MKAAMGRSGVEEVLCIVAFDARQCQMSGDERAFSSRTEQRKGRISRQCAIEPRVQGCDCPARH